jgi:nicotinamide mononucleotide transporter
MITKMNVYIQAAIISIGLTVLSFVSGVALGWLNPSELNWIEIAAVATSYYCTWLSYHQKRWYYGVAVITTALYVIVFLQSSLIASAILNIYLVPTVIFGFFRWGKDSQAKPVQRFAWKWLPVYLGVTAIFYFGALYVTTALGGTMAPLDSMILVGTILAQFLLDNKVLGNWFVWIAVNVVSIYVYFSSGLFFAGTQYILFLVGAVYGFVQWKRSMVKPEYEDMFDDTSLKSSLERA